MTCTVELLSPAGNLEKLKFALAYGCDAVYLSGKQFGLRQFAGNFTRDELCQAVSYTHQKQKKIYVTVNIFARDRDFSRLPHYLHFLSELSVDAIIVSDPGIFAVARKTVPNMRIHISTQANTLNSEAVKFWTAAGASRVILGRELSLAEAGGIKKNTGASLEIFVHGALCVSYSGRCYVSTYLTGRDANRGACTHPCRWQYTLHEETRPDEPMILEEDSSGSYLFNSKDLNCIALIPDILANGIDSFKIEGRMKSVYYVAVTTGVYRQALSLCCTGQAAYEQALPRLQQELDAVSHRHYTTGFYTGATPGPDDYNYAESRYRQTHDFLGTVEEILPDGQVRVGVRNKIFNGEPVEIIEPGLKVTGIDTLRIRTADGIEVSHANPNDIIFIEPGTALKQYAIIRRIKSC